MAAAQTIIPDSHALQVQESLLQVGEEACGWSVSLAAERAGREEIVAREAVQFRNPEAIEQR